MLLEKIKHNCKENDNHFFVNGSDGIYDEILVGDPLEKSWIVIGIRDLKKGLQKAGFDIVEFDVEK